MIVGIAAFSCAPGSENSEPAGAAPIAVSAAEPSPTGSLRVFVRAHEDGATLDAEVRLTSTTPSGEPTVRSTRTHQGDVSWTDLSPGAHRIDVESADRFASSFEIALLRGETRDLRVELERSQAVTLLFDPTDRVAAELMRSIEFTDRSGVRRTALRAKAKVSTSLGPDGCAVRFAPVPNSDIVIHIGGKDIPTSPRPRLGLVLVPRLEAIASTQLFVTGFESESRARSARLSIARDDPMESVGLETQPAADGSSITTEFRAPSGPCLLRVTIGDGDAETYLLPLAIDESRRELRVEIP